MVERFIPVFHFFCNHSAAVSANKPRKSPDFRKRISVRKSGAGTAQRNSDEFRAAIFDENRSDHALDGFAVAKNHELAGIAVNAKTPALHFGKKGFGANKAVNIRGFTPDHLAIACRPRGKELGVELLWGLGLNR